MAILSAHSTTYESQRSTARIARDHHHCRLAHPRPRKTLCTYPFLSTNTNLALIHIHLENQPPSPPSLVLAHHPPTPAHALAQPRKHKTPQIRRRAPCLTSTKAPSFCKKAPGLASIRNTSIPLHRQRQDQPSPAQHDYKTSHLQSLQLYTYSALRRWEKGTGWIEEKLVCPVYAL